MTQPLSNNQQAAPEQHLATRTAKAMFNSKAFFITTLAVAILSVITLAASTVLKVNCNTSACHSVTIGFLAAGVGFLLLSGGTLALLPKKHWAC